MDEAGGNPRKQIRAGFDAATQDEYASLSTLLQEFTKIPTFDKAWNFDSGTEAGSQAMFLISQPDLLSNKLRKSMLSSHILQKSNNAVSFHWAQFPIDMTSVSAMVPSISGSKLLVIRNSEGGSPTRFEIWDPSGVKEEFAVPPSIHGPVYSDGCPDGKFLVFLSAKCSVDSGAHLATESLHKIEWPSDGKLSQSLKIIELDPFDVAQKSSLYVRLALKRLLLIEVVELFQVS